MLQVVGADGTREFSAATELRTLILRAWPDAAEHSGCDIRIVANAKCHGQRIRDIDIVLLASIAPGISFPSFLPFMTTDGSLHTPDVIEVRSLAAVIEVKDHSPEDVRFVGTRVEVRYGDEWKDASEQNESQVFSVKRYLEYHGLHAPHITPLLWLRNVSNADLPHRPHSILGSPLT